MAAAGNTLIDNIRIRRTALNIFSLNGLDEPHRLKIDRFVLRLVFICELPYLSHQMRNGKEQAQPCG
jgi:hypothetical protein